MEDPFIPRARGASPCNLFLLMSFWSVNLSGARPSILQSATKRPIFLILCRCCTLCTASRGNLTSHRFQLCWPLQTLLLTFWHTICDFSVDFKGLQLQNFLWFYWHAFFCAILHDFRDQQLQFFSIFTAAFKSLFFEVFHPSSVSGRLVSIAFTLPLLLQHLGQVPFLRSRQFNLPVSILLPCSSNDYPLMRFSSLCLFYLLWLPTTRCRLLLYISFLSTFSQSSSYHSRATKHYQPRLLFDALMSECICLGYVPPMPPLQSGLFIVCKVFPQPCNATFPVSSFLLPVTFLTHFDVCLVHLLLMFWNRCFPTPLSVYKHQQLRPI